MVTQETGVELGKCPPLGEESPTSSVDEGERVQERQKILNATIDRPLSVFFSYLCIPCPPVLRRSHYYYDVVGVFLPWGRRLPPDGSKDRQFSSTQRLVRRLE